jgi:hypothetical protein
MQVEMNPEQAEFAVKVLGALLHVLSTQAVLFQKQAYPDEFVTQAAYIVASEQAALLTHPPPYFVVHAPPMIKALHASSVV